MKRLCILFPIFVLIITFSLNINAVSNPKIYIEDATKYENSENVTLKIDMENVNEDMEPRNWDTGDRGSFSVITVKVSDPHGRSAHLLR